MIGTDVALAHRLLEEGKLVAIPTETVYGLAANALDPEAVSRIYAAKNRPSFNPLILHFASLHDARNYVTTIPKEAEILASEFWPGPLSLLLPKSDLVPDIITAGSSNVVIRVPNNELTNQLMQMVDFPIAAPSANISNTVSPTSASHVADGLGNSVSYILDGGECSVGLESTIVSFENGSIQILREGGISREQILSQTGLKIEKRAASEIEAPGQLSKHYSTQKPLYIVDDFENYMATHPTLKCSLLYFDLQKTEHSCSYYLSYNYNMAEIANRLFATLRLADQDNSDCILIQPIKEKGIGRAIADRLRRASSKLG